MKYVQGHDRNQLSIFPVSIDQSIPADNEVRIIDMFVESIDLKEFQFRLDYTENGRPAYHPSCLIKLFLYGYMNKIRSSRDLEKECGRNIELMWLMKGLKPDHNTISNFRRDNSTGIREVFRLTVKTAKYFSLIGRSLLAGDSTKLRAQNSKKNNYNQAKIDRHLEYIENKLQEYRQLLATEDKDHIQPVSRAMRTQLERRAKYQRLEQQLNDTGQEQVSTSDTESRQMITRNNITEVAYNVQTTVDAEHNILIDYKVTNSNDSKAMGEMLERAISVVETTGFTALYDKGYHTGSELKTGQALGVNLLVAIPQVASNAPDRQYNVSCFRYDGVDDIYTCPANQQLLTNGKWYNKNRGNNREAILVKQYKTKSCKTCPVKRQCTTSTKNGRVIERSQYADNIEANKLNVEQNQKLYKRRQAIVEHPYGTIKRQWGFNYILTKQGINRASADVGLMFTAYNLRRIINIIGVKRLWLYLSLLVPRFFRIIPHLKSKIRHSNALNILQNINLQFFVTPLNRLTFIQIFRFNLGF